MFSIKKIIRPVMFILTMFMSFSALLLCVFELSYRFSDKPVLKQSNNDIVTYSISASAFSDSTSYFSYGSNDDYQYLSINNLPIYASVLTDTYDFKYPPISPASTVNYVPYVYHLNFTLYNQRGTLYHSFDDLNSFYMASYAPHGFPYANKDKFFYFYNQLKSERTVVARHFSNVKLTTELTSLYNNLDPVSYSDTVFGVGNASNSFYRGDHCTYFGALYMHWLLRGVPSQTYLYYQLGATPSFNIADIQTIFISIGSYNSLWNQVPSENPDVPPLFDTTRVTDNGNSCVKLTFANGTSLTSPRFVIYFPFLFGASPHSVSAYDSSVYNFTYSGFSFSGNTSIDSAYNNGYNNGYIAGLNVGNSNGVSYKNGYNAGYDAGYSVGFSRGVASANDYSFVGLFSAVFDVPVSVFTSMFDYEILGVNLKLFIMGLFTLCVTITLLRWIT